MGLNLDIPVTVSADFGLVPTHCHRVLTDMHLVAAYASHALSLMGPAIPVHTLISPVTVETNAILFFSRPESTVAKCRYRRAFLIKAEPFRMISTWPMTGLTLMFCKRGPGISRHCMRGLENVHNGDFAAFIMAGQAGLSAFFGIFRGRIRFVLRHPLNATGKPAKQHNHPSEYQARTVALFLVADPDHFWFLFRVVICRADISVQ